MWKEDRSASGFCTSTVPTVLMPVQESVADHSGGSSKRALYLGAQLTVPQHSFPATAQFKERSCACFWRDLLKAVSAADHPGGIHPHHGYENRGRLTPGVSPGVSWGRRWGHPTLPSTCLSMLRRNAPKLADFWPGMTDAKLQLRPLQTFGRTTPRLLLDGGS